MRDGWIPRTNSEKLILIDTVLAGVIPVFTSTRERIGDLLPGHSGRPAGNGEPPGGSGGGGATLVERTVLGHDLGPDDPDDIAVRLPSSPERLALAELDRLAISVVDRVVMLAPPGVPGPADVGAVRRLVWARWAVRQMAPRVRGVTSRRIDALWTDVARLDELCTVWGEPRTVAARDVELAVDDTEEWCRSHLRVGARERRSPRYTSDGLCRTCGDFVGEHGWLPTLDILDALVSGMHGSTIAKLIRDEQTRRRPVKRKRKGRK